MEENKCINQIRSRFSQWRQGGYVGITRTTRRLLDYWNDPDKERKLFFCQIEARETAIYLTEVANKFGGSWIENHLREGNEEENPGLFRISFKRATGSGKTVVMAMLIAWNTLNKLGRVYRDLLGNANQFLAQRATDVYFMAAGIPLKIKG